jgi:hypothetical protein
MLEAFRHSKEFAAETLAVIAKNPDLTLLETITGLRKRRIRTGRSSLWRFLDRHNVTLKNKPSSRRTAASRYRASTPTSDTRARFSRSRPFGVYRRNFSQDKPGAAKGACPKGREGDRHRSAWITGDDHRRGGLALQ